MIKAEPIIKPQRYPRKYCKQNIRSKEEIVCTWDTETAGLNGALECITYSTPIHDAILSGDSMVDDFISILESWVYPHVWYAHNSQYDWRYIISSFLESDHHIEIFNKTDDEIYMIIIYLEKPIPISSTLSKQARKAALKYNKEIPVIIMRDSMALFPGSLEEFCKYYGNGETKGKLDFEKESFSISNPKHVAYAIQDARALRFAVSNFRLKFEELFGCSPGGTLPGSALRAWQFRMEKDENYWCLDVEKEDMIDKAYYGGIVFLTSTDEHHNCKSFDINSSYPSQMLDHEFPFGKPVSTKVIIPGYPAFYHVRISTPSNLIIPIIPTKDEKGNMVWRRGEFATWISSIELEFALSKGYRLLEFYEGLVFPEKINPFRDFIGICKELKLSSDKEPAIRNMAKLLQNSFYGKFATKRTRDKLYIPQTEEELEGGRCIDSDLGIWSQIVEDYQMLRMPQWSAWITAHARLDLLRVVYSLGVENVLYGDTDSITVKETADISKVPQHDIEYGFFKLEKTWESFRVIAPKVYVGKIAGQTKGKVKGIPKKKINPDLLERIQAGERIQVDYESTPKLTQIIKGNATAGSGTTKRKRALSSLENSGNWQEEGGKVIPKLYISA